MKFSIASVSSTWPPKRSATTPVRDALARGVDRRGRAGRAAADDQHVEGSLALSFAAARAAAPRVELGEDLLEAHASLAEGLAVQNRRSARP